ncbi:MAG: ester cyclase [Bacteroidales bacterium]|jgi:predicted ester cyclase
MENVKEMVSTFYTKCLTVNSETNVEETMGKLLAENFQSVNAKETKGKAALIGQVQFFWKLIPNLTWEPQEILQDGNKVIVRSIFSGSPKGEFMGMNLDGSKSFQTMSIDIHTVKDNQIVMVHHIEEWATAIAQLKA